MTPVKAIDLYYDPFDFDIDDDPYPVWKRMREEAPLYHNEKYNFYALSRYDDVARELPNWDTYRSGPRHDRRHPVQQHRDSAGNPALRGPAASRPA